VSTPEDDGVRARLLQRRGVLADRFRCLGAERLVALDQGNEPRAGDGEESDAGVERVDEVGITAGGHRRLCGHQADVPVAGGLYGRMCLGRDHSDDGHCQPLLELGQGG
jgi:hypothetical protein